MMEVTTKTIIYPDGKIGQEIFSEHDGHIQEISRTILDTKEEQIRKALIKLGWTPPGKGDRCSLCQGTGVMPGYHDTDEYYKED